MSARSCCSTTCKCKQFAVHLERYAVTVYLWPELLMMREENREVDDDDTEKGVSKDDQTEHNVQASRTLFQSW